MNNHNPAGRALLCGHIAREVHLRLQNEPRDDTYIPIVSSIDSLGGSVSFGALALAAGGFDVTIVGPKAPDSYARYADTIFARLGIEWQVTSRPESTPVFYSIYAPNHARWVAHSDFAFRSPGIATIPVCDFVILYPAAPEDMVDIATLANAGHVDVVLTPSASLFRFPEVFRPLCRMSSYVILNADEARFYANRATLEQATADLRTLCDNIVVTSGSKGALLVTAGAEFRSGTSPLDACLDAGAGDVFSAVFAACVFCGRIPPPQSLEIAQSLVHRFLARGDIPLEARTTLDIFGSLEGV